MEVLLLRHAPTDWNREGRIQGRTDVPLSVEGQAMAAAWRLPDAAKDWACLSSPLGRALETARAMGLAPSPDAAFVEMDWGRLEGRRLEEIRAEGGAAFASDEARGLDFRPQGG
ncbi:MAG: histidine phosphatase family protein, partial [Rhizobiaceae bacterium]|nr:histidine phosphatase family protein [Rhizobiaceae bacterium]